MSEFWCYLGWTVAVLCFAWVLGLRAALRRARYQYEVMIKGYNEMLDSAHVKRRELSEEKYKLLEMNHTLENRVNQLRDSYGRLTLREVND